METTTNAPTVRGVGTKFGLISAGFSIFFFLVLTLVGLNAFDNKWSWIGLIVSIVIMVFAHKQFKDQGDGFMSYGQGVGIGFWIALISLLIAGGFTFIYVNFIDQTAMDAFYDTQRMNMEDKGMPDDQIDVAISWTRKLFWLFYFFFGIFFGVLVAVIVSIFTQKKNPQQAI
ncbi:MAG TPA: DUF4199 domain-containing protein [Cyclobacteriaceae bacterium]|nr:DUF4199 domain-containing protein [Cyclobacteriaceae bacterium]